MVSTPKAPDPAATAATQAGLNRETAITQQQLNMVNQQTPYGSLTYKQTGNNFTPSDNGQTYYYNASTGEYRSDAPMVAGTSATVTNTPASLGGRNAYGSESGKGGGTYKRSASSRVTQTLEPGWSQVKGSMTPSYTAVTELSPQQQQILDQTQGANLNLGKLANQQSGFLLDYMNKPFSYNNQDAENWAYDLGAQRLDPRFAQQEASLRDQLVASGIRPGTAAYSKAMNDFGQTRNDAYNQLMLNGRQQAFQEALTTRNQPINEISALLSGSQVQQPNFVATLQTGVGGVDYTGLVNKNYEAELAGSQAAAGGLFGLLSAPFQMSTGFAGLLKSDRRLKEGIEPVARLANGLTIYRFRYAGDPATRIGLMADEVKALHPDAVKVGADGFAMVDYARALEPAPDPRDEKEAA